MAIKTDDTLWVWGRNGRYQLGLSNTTAVSSPIQLPGSWSSVKFANAAQGVKTDGTMWSWGYNQFGGLGQNNRTEYDSPVQIPGTTWSTNLTAVLESNSLLAIKTDNTLWAWGQNQRGDLAQNDTVKRSSPVQIPGTTWFDVGGGQFSVALKQS